MSYVVALAVAILGLFAASTWLAVWSRRDTWGRPAAMGLFLLGVPAITVAGVESLGWHKPMSLAWDLEAGDHRVLAVKMVQDEAIYLYLDDGTRIEPRPLMLPWDNGTANRIQALMDESGPEANGEFMLRYEPSLDISEQQFHPLPQPPVLPPKVAPEPAPHFNPGA